MELMMGWGGQLLVKVVITGHSQPQSYLFSGPGVKCGNLRLQQAPWVFPTQAVQAPHGEKVHSPLGLTNSSFPPFPLTCLAPRVPTPTPDSNF